MRSTFLRPEFYFHPKITFLNLEWNQNYFASHLQIWLFPFKFRKKFGKIDEYYVFIMFSNDNASQKNDKSLTTDLKSMMFFP